MKERIIITLCNIIISCFSHAQIKISGYVFSKEETPIPYTSVYSPENSTGTITDINGYFHIEVVEVPATLEFSNVGYDKLKKKIEDSSKVKITLNEKIITLNEVNIYADDIKSRYIGSPKNKRGIVLYEVPKPFHQFAIKVENKNLQLYKNANLISFSIKITSSFIEGLKPNGTRQLRLRIYNINDEGVGEDILHENIFLTPQKSGWYKKNIKKPFLLPDNGFFIATEWIEGLELREWESKKYI